MVQDVAGSSPVGRPFKAMRVALLQMDLAWQDAGSNRAAVERAIESAALAPGAFVLAPEMTDTGFVHRADEKTPTDGAAFAVSTARRFGVWYQHGCIEVAKDGFGRNLAVVASPEGRVAARYEKIHPFGYGAETEGFRGGGEITPFDTGEARLAPFICYDLRFPEVWRLAALAGAEVFMIGANWPDARQAHWRALCISRAIENQAYVVACNRIGKDPQSSYRGGSLVISPKGEIVAEAGDGPATITAELDLQTLREWRERFPALRDMRRRFLGRFPLVTRDSHEVAHEIH